VSAKNQHKENVIIKTVKSCLSFCQEKVKKLQKNKIGFGLVVAIKKPFLSILNLL